MVEAQTIEKHCCRNSMLENDLNEFVEFILHGDENHQAWLKESVKAFLCGDPRPPTRGAKDVELESLRKLVDELIEWNHNEYGRGDMAMFKLGELISRAKELRKR